MFIGGIVLIILGLVLVLVGVVVQNTATSVGIPAGSADQLSPSSIGGSSFSGTWTGASASTTVYLITGAPTCSSTPQGIVAQGTGAGGTISASLSSGSTYQLYACSAGSGVALNVSWTATGLSILMVIGIVLALVGIVVGFLGWRGQPKDAPAEMPAEERPADPPAA